MLRLDISTGQVSDDFTLADSHTWDLEWSSEDQQAHHMFPVFQQLVYMVIGQSWKTQQDFAFHAVLCTLIHILLDEPRLIQVQESEIDISLMEGVSSHITQGMNMKKHRELGLLFNSNHKKL